MNRNPERLRIAGVLLMMLVVGCGFLGGLGLLFHFHGDKAPEIIEDNFRGGLVVFVLSLIAVIAFIRSHYGNTWVLHKSDPLGIRQRRWTREARLRSEENQRRMQRLALDPETRKYAELIAQGKQWTDEQIAYDRDPGMLMSCVHLQPVERAMRHAGIPIRPLPFYRHRLDAKCCIDVPAFEHRFAISFPVVLVTISGDRQYDPESMSLLCKEHDSSIELVLPYEAKPDTPRFP